MYLLSKVGCQEGPSFGPGGAKHPVLTHVMFCSGYELVDVVSKTREAWASWRVLDLT